MCGVVGITNRSNATKWISRGLYALQHRGHDSCGVAYLDSGSGHIEVHSDSGAVADVLPDEVTSGFNSDMAIGQNLYTTYGSKSSIQPFSGRFWSPDGTSHQLAVVHNGQLCGIDRLRKKYPAMYRTHSDSEIIFSLLPHMPGENLIEKIRALLMELEGAFSLIFLLDDKIMAVRDTSGFRPLVIGKDREGAIVFASEINAFDLMDVDYIRDVKPGEIVEADTSGNIKSYYYNETKQKLNQCVFEHIYFARPDNLLFGKNCYSTRQALGVQVAKEVKEKVVADIVVSIPDSSNISSIGFANELGLPFHIGLLRHHYAARTFITRGQNKREEAVRLKFNVVKGVVKGKRIFLCDDSLVRSTTSKIVISMLREGGAKEIHFVLFSPPISFPCVYGINMATKDELIAHALNNNMSDIAKAIDADSVNYLSMDGLRKVMGEDNEDYCYACMDGKYSTNPEFSESFTS